MAYQLANIIKVIYHPRLSCKIDEHTQAAAAKEFPFYKRKDEGVPINSFSPNFIHLLIPQPFHEHNKVYMHKQTYICIYIFSRDKMQ